MLAASEGFFCFQCHAFLFRGRTCHISHLSHRVLRIPFSSSWLEYLGQISASHYSAPHARRPGGGGGGGEGGGGWRAPGGPAAVDSTGVRRVEARTEAQKPHSSLFLMPSFPFRNLIQVSACSSVRTYTCVYCYIQPMCVGYAMLEIGPYYTYVYGCRT